MRNIRWISLWLLLFLAACSASAPKSQEAQATVPTIIPTATPSPTLPNPTITPGATATPTAAPTSPPKPSPTQAVEPVMFPDPGRYTWQPVITGLASPIGIANAGDGSGRLFIIEQAGQVRVAQDGQLLPTPFLDIQNRIGSSGNEQGLLGLAFHPNYSENGFFYVNYTDQNGDTVIARYQVSDQDSNQANPESEERLLFIPQPYPNHNGGSVVFGPDGYLYLGLGDGGSGGDPLGNGQSLNTTLGKILRIDVDGVDPYAIPPDNPFDGETQPEVWASGLRNPWRFSFDSLTGDLYIGDVGQGQWEEISFLPAGSPGGANFGWNYYEGSHLYNGTPPSGYEALMPIAEYDHSQGCSVTGGYVYRGKQLSELQGLYLFGDYCSGSMWGLRRDAQGAWQMQLLFSSLGLITSFGEDEAGELYLADRNGTVYRLQLK